MAKLTEKIKQIWSARDLRKNILVVLGILIIARIAAHVPIPGIDTAGLQAFFASNQILGLLNVFSGGGLENFSVAMLGVGPYITSSIIFQLLGMVVPSLEKLQKEGGEEGRRKINQWTRIATIPLGMLQGYAFIRLLQSQVGGQNQVLSELSNWEMFLAVMTVTAGTVFLMWLGELITERNVGNGISLLIFVGIISSLPSVIQQTLAIFDVSQIINLVVFIVLALVTIAGVVFITEGQRNIPVSYARQVRGSKYAGGVSTHLPLRVNIAGVIPIIFAIAIILFPPMVAQFFVQAKSAWLANFATEVITIFQNQIFYGFIYFALVVAFTFFYTSIIFQPKDVAENLQKQGSFIPGVRPGRQTAEYLQTTMSRLVLFGALFLGLIAVLPLLVRPLTGFSSLAIGGTSLLIVVQVVIEIVKQIDAQLVMRHYDGL